VRHRVYGKHLGRDKNQRTALFKSLVGALILHGSIETTETKAKAIKGLVDKIITQAKSKSNRDLVTAFLTQKTIQDQLFKVVVPGVSNRNSGYTSTVKLGRRLGDNAMKVRMSLLVEGRESSGLSSKKAPVKVETKKEVEPTHPASGGKKLKKPVKKEVKK
jgi:large subunit ribosomal protein L17